MRSDVVGLHKLWLVELVCVILSACCSVGYGKQLEVDNWLVWVETPQDALIIGVFWMYSELTVHFNDVSYKNLCQRVSMIGRSSWIF